MWYHSYDENLKEELYLLIVKWLDKIWCLYYLYLCLRIIKEYGYQSTQQICLARGNHP